jgi:imidazolonepropionase-like amidohydrolase
MSGRVLADTQCTSWNVELRGRGARGAGRVRMLLRGLIAFGLAGLPWHAVALDPDPYPSTYRSADAPPTLIRGATILTGAGERIDGGDVLLVEGRIEAVAPGLQPPAGARVIAAEGRWVTPGLIDVHSHLGLNASPAVRAHIDGNESTSPATPALWAEHSILPQEPGFEAALAGGVTTLQVMPGSANLIGGRTVVLKNVRAATVQAMKFPGAAQGLKLACGENPKRIHGQQKGEFPSTRMGNVAGLRARWAEARDYRRKWQAYEATLAQRDSRRRVPAGEALPDPPDRDLALETLSEALDGRIAVHQHCYRADEMAIALDTAGEFGYRIAAFHHATEAYKIAGLLAARGVCAAMWSDWWGFKMEAYDGIQENVAFVDAAPAGCAIVHSDSEEGIQRLNQEAAKAMTRGQRAGIDVRPEHAIEWITANAAKALGILARVGTLEVGKMADVVLWNGDPFSVYALAEQVWIDGSLEYDRAASPLPPDFLLGQPAVEARP